MLKHIVTTSQDDQKNIETDTFVGLYLERFFTMLQVLVHINYLYMFSGPQRSSLKSSLYWHSQTLSRCQYTLVPEWPCIIEVSYFILLQLVTPTLKSHAATRHVTTRTCHCEQTFQDGPSSFSCHQRKFDRFDSSLPLRSLRFQVSYFILLQCFY